MCPVSDTIQGDSKLSPGFSWPIIFKMKKTLFAGYENVTQNVLLLIESILQNVKKLQHARLSWHVICPSGIQFPSKCSPAFAV
jgi:hypothetical protein